MIVDWQNMKPHVCGDGVDLIGRQLPADTHRVNTLTGEVWTLAKYSDGSFVFDEVRGEIVELCQKFTPPITVWLFL